MKKPLFLVTILFSCLTYAKADLIVAGDSWSFLPCLFNSFNNAFLENEMTVEVNNCLVTSRPGARAEDFASLPAFAKTIEELKENKSAKVIYLSLGGNDMFNYWNKNLTATDEMVLFLRIKENIEKIILEFKKVNPKIHILISGYDYGYLYDNNPIDTYQEIFERMGKPTAFEVNSAFLRLTAVLAQISMDKVTYIHHFGVMHYHYGIPEAGIKPFQTMPPEDISSTNNILSYGGDINFRSSPKAMIHIFDYYYDPHHLSPRGYEHLIHHSIDLFLRHIL